MNRKNIDVHQKSTKPFRLWLTVPACIAMALLFSVSGFAQSDDRETVDPKAHLEKMNKMIQQMAKDGINTTGDIKVSAPAK